MFRTPRRVAITVASLWALSSLPGSMARSADEPTSDRAVVASSFTPKSRPVPPDLRRQSGPVSRGETTSGWWFGPVGIAAAFAIVGGLSLASKRFNLNLGLARDSGPVGVVGQTRLSPKHSVYLVRVGGRVLILGAGAAESPTTLGEVTDPDELARLIPQRQPRAGLRGAPTVKLPSTTRTSRFDQRIGDDE